MEISESAYENVSVGGKKIDMKKLLPLLTASAVAFSLVGCAGSSSSSTATSASTTGSTASNADKPLVWFNRQPSNSSTGELDKTALNFNDKTYYVGFDAKQGAELQGKMIADYINANISKIDRNGDGIIGYVLAIGDIGHNDSIARTRGVRNALGTAVKGSDGNADYQPVGTNTDGSSKDVQDGTIGNLKVRELASQEMKNSAGATWDAATAGNAIGTWSSSFGDQIDVVISNNDGMGMSMFTAWSKDKKVPTFGYDANSDAVAAIAEGYSGTISQHADVQAYLTLRVLRNSLDGVDVMTGISTKDDAGNVLTDSDYKYVADERSFYALNLAVTADNYKDFMDSTVAYKPVANQLDSAKHASKKVWLDTYNSADNFLGSTYVPLLQKYDKLLNLNVEYIAGDGQTESNITNRLGNPSEYDAYAINMVKTDNAASYTALLK
jgi:methyl-galactoside transport system substrate-binding protein